MVPEFLLFSRVSLRVPVVFCRFSAGLRQCSCGGCLVYKNFPEQYSMLCNSPSGSEIGLPGRILAGLLPGKHRHRPPGRPSATRRADFGAVPAAVRKIRPGRPIYDPEALSCNMKYPGRKHMVLRTLCYAIVLPGRKSAFRAGFWPDCYRESIAIDPSGGRRPARGPISMLSR